MAHKHWFAPLCIGMFLFGCQPAEDPANTESSVDRVGFFEGISGTGFQYHALRSRAVWAETGAEAAAVPTDPGSYVGISKAFGNGTRHDIYYIAVAGPSDTAGQVLCQASAELEVREVPSFPAEERVVATARWGPDTCGWDIEAQEIEQVYVWIDSTRTLYLWDLSDDFPADLESPWEVEGTMQGKAGTFPLKACDDADLPLIGITVDHPQVACDAEKLYGTTGVVKIDT